MWLNETSFHSHQFLHLRFLVFDSISKGRITVEIVERDVQIVIHSIITGYFILLYSDSVLLLDTNFNIQALPFFRNNIDTGPHRIEKDDSFRSLEIIRIVRKRIFMIMRDVLTRFFFGRPEALKHRAIKRRRGSNDSSTFKKFSTGYQCRSHSFHTAILLFFVLRLMINHPTKLFN